MTAKRSPSNTYLKYSGLAIQFFVLIAIAAWLGGKADAAMDNSRPWITILLILLFSTGFFYKLILDLNRKDDP